MTHAGQQFQPVSLTHMTTTKLLAYNGKTSVKRKYLGRIRKHRELDQLVQGYGYWKDGRGCAVGCTIHSGNHSAYETELGIPSALAHLEDRLFENLPVELARQWPEGFLSAIKPGADLSLVLPKFMVWMLSDSVDGVIRFAKREDTKLAIQGVSALFVRWAAGDKPTTSEWESARKIAAYAADAAYAAYAAYAAAAAAAARSKHYQKMADKLIELLKEAK